MATKKYKRRNRKRNNEPLWDNGDHLNAINGRTDPRMDHSIQNKAQDETKDGYLDYHADYDYDDLDGYDYIDPYGGNGFGW